MQGGWIELPISSRTQPGNLSAISKRHGETHISICRTQPTQYRGVMITDRHNVIASPQCPKAMDVREKCLWPHLDHLHHALFFMFYHVAMKHKAPDDFRVGKRYDQLCSTRVPFFIGATLKVSRRPSNRVGMPLTSVTRNPV